MKRDNSRLRRLTMSAYILYIAAGLLLKLIPRIAESLGVEGIGLLHGGYIFESYIYIPLFAVAIPLLIAWCHGLSLHEPASKSELRMGCIPIAVFAALWIMLIVIAWSFLEMIFRSPMFDAIMLNMVHNLINGFGACIICFFLIPRTLQHTRKNSRRIIDIFISAGAFILLCLIGIIAGMPLMWGLLIGLGCGFSAVYTRSLYLTYGAYILGSVMFQQLSLDLFGSWNGLGIVLGLIILVILIFSLMGTRKKNM